MTHQIDKTHFPMTHQIKKKKTTPPPAKNIIKNTTTHKKKIKLIILEKRKFSGSHIVQCKHSIISLYEVLTPAYSQVHKMKRTHLAIFSVNKVFSYQFRTL